jgi:hypothetical protein
MSRKAVLCLILSGMVYLLLIALVVRGSEQAAAKAIQDVSCTPRQTEIK